ncbi:MULTISPECIES: TonB-dependent receptor [Citromicrobium]|uniref:TonB-dependent receptor n=1 Tax=Citromicrobium TaxID=72173 RepID=UPI0006C917C6|nr:MULTISPECIES: TonB-dependent receptor [Citromicrobium]KPM25099.1 TonB-dependent receptor [Citromicrobium sp. RCC1885]KPM28340.1 TonB-dependent receptor [Citromicrobium sp. RCC1878]MCD1621595.1 TonB-dependent receptor [Citromicrobium bathyomarinum]OAM10128.1 TonB-dependent receptor [Citromicrobium sp. RCC1897]
MKAILTRSIALGALAGGLAFQPVAALAQTTDAQDTEAELQEELDGGTTIVVTAQGRTQELTDVPVAVNVVSAEELRNSGASDIRELNQVAPSLLVSSTGNEANGSARIRGIGTVGDNPGLESSVAVFVDGVYRSRSGNALSELGPIERVEVLRGPQGTLGGRNSSAGLINIYTAPPEFEFSGYGAFTYGNYDAVKVEAGINAPLGDTVAARLDGVYFRRDGFYNDVVNDVDVNNRDRYLIRGQMLFEPTDTLSIRLTGDYSKKDEACCAATFVQPEFAPLARVSPGLDPFARPDGGPALTSTQNPIVNILLGLGQNPNALTQSTFDRDIYVTPGRSYDGETEDYGAALELNWDFGGAQLTSITGYRDYSNTQGSDTDYTQVDILYRAPGPNAGAREFKTFSQELRLQGEAFGGTLDWLVGGYFANEKLETRDNLRFGTQYGTFANCRIALAINPALANPSAANCFGANIGALTAANGGAGAFGAATPLIIAGINNLATVRDRGSTGDVYNQESTNWALFTHNIINITDRLNLTLGLRYTNENKDFSASFGNDNTACPTNRALLGPLLGVPALAGLAGGLISLSCQGNSTSELNGVSIADSRDEDEFTGTAIISFKPTDRLMTYASYSRGYKAGGFNLDRSALQASPLVGNPAVTGSTANLQFGQETVDAFEVGGKYDGRDWTLTAAAFYQRFSNFQLNTFNGSVFLVQNVNSCGADLGGADRDASGTTGACAADDVQPGVIAKGVELELGLRPARFLNANLGLTYADTSYETNLIGNDTGAPLDPALRLLPGDNLSNAPEITATASLSYTPPIGNSGLTGLFYINTRMTSDYNTGSDLLYGKEQDGYVLVNGRIGIRGPDEKWAIELWAQNLFDQDYTQVAINTPFVAPQQTYSAYLAEPRTYGITVRAGF